MLALPKLSTGYRTGSRPGRAISAAARRRGGRVGEIEHPSPSQKKLDCRIKLGNDEREVVSRHPKKAPDFSGAESSEKMVVNL
jgi:hypothetical protein